MTYIYLTTISIGITTIILSLIALVSKLIKERINRFSVNENIENILLKQRTVIDKWVTEIERKTKATRINIKIKRFITHKILITIITFLLSLLYFKNLTATIFLSISMFFVPDYIINLIDNARKTKEEKQLIAAIRIFSSEYMQHYQLGKAFAAIYSKIPSPLGTYFGDAYYGLMVSKPVNTVLMELFANIDNYYGKMFIHLMMQISKDSTVLNLLPDLIIKIEEKIGLTQTNKTSLTGERILAFIMTMAPIPIYLLMKSFIPEIEYFVIHTILGRIIITSTFLSFFLFIIIDKAMGGI